MSSLDYIDLKHLDTANTVDGYQLEQYENPVRENYTLLLRSERFGQVLQETTVKNREDAQQLLEASKETPIREVLQQ